MIDLCVHSKNINDDCSNCHIVGGAMIDSSVHPTYLAGARRSVNQIDVIGRHLVRDGAHLRRVQTSVQNLCGTNANEIRK